MITVITEIPPRLAFIDSLLKKNNSSEEEIKSILAECKKLKRAEELLKLDVLLGYTPQKLLVTKNRFTFQKLLEFIEARKNMITFSQEDFIYCMSCGYIDEKKEKQLKKLLERYNGFCDIICNHITDKDLLRDPEAFEEYGSYNVDNFKQKIEKLADYSETHVLNINSIKRFFQLLLCMVFQYYPESPLSLSEQKSLNGTKTRDLAMNKVLDSMKEGDYYKLCTIKKRCGFIMNGHSMLIYKAQDGTFRFFDPNTGVTPNLNKERIKQKIEDSRKEWGPQFNGGASCDIAIMDNKKFLSKNHGEFLNELQAQQLINEKSSAVSQ